MKLTKLFGIVLSLHLGVAGMLLFQPGCQTIQKEGEPEASPEQTIISEKQQERARILIGENNDEAVVVQGQTADAFNADTIRNRRYLPSRPVEPIIPETPAEVVEMDIEPLGDNSLFNSTETVDLVLPDAKPLEFDIPVTETANMSREVYFVQKGDSLWKISRKFGTTVEALMEENGLTKSSVLKIDQKLYLPGTAGSLTGVSQSVPTTSMSSGKVSMASGNVYTVVKGDTLSKIAKMYGVTVSSLKSANGLFSDRINVGQKLTIPEGGVSGGYSAPSSFIDNKPAPTTPTSGSVYVVRKGDTLGKIAMMHGLTTGELARLNNLADPNRLRVGQRLTVVGSGSNAVSSSAPAFDVSAPAPVKTNSTVPKSNAVKIEEVPMFDTDLKLDLDSSDLNDNFFEQDLDIPVVDVIKAE